MHIKQLRPIEIGLIPVTGAKLQKVMQLCKSFDKKQAFSLDFYAIKHTNGTFMCHSAQFDIQILWNYLHMSFFFRTFASEIIGCDGQQLIIRDCKTFNAQGINEIIVINT